SSWFARSSPTSVLDGLLAGFGGLRDARDPEAEALLQPLAPALELDTVNLVGLQLLDQVVELLLVPFVDRLLVLVLQVREIPAHVQRLRDSAADDRDEFGRRERIL